MKTEMKGTNNKQGINTYLFMLEERKISGIISLICLRLKHKDIEQEINKFLQEKV